METLPSTCCANNAPTFATACGTLYSVQEGADAPKQRQLNAYRGNSTYLVHFTSKPLLTRQPHADVIPHRPFNSGLQICNLAWAVSLPL